jgi:hypothetical protein
MADGTTRPIEDLNIGDQVASTDMATGKTVAKPVTLLHVNRDRDLTDVKVKNQKTGKISTLHTTAHHPFWDQGDHRWVDAGRLKPGTRLKVATERAEQAGHARSKARVASGEGARPPTGDRVVVTVVGVTNYAGAKVMRDLTIADTHTYYVLTGTTPVLVHNCGTENVSENGYEWDHEEMKSLLYGELDDKGGLTILADMKRSPVRGRTVFGRMMKAFGDRVKTINGNLVDENKASYSKALAAGLAPEEAAFETWTGKMARDHGFTEVVHADKEVRADAPARLIFRKPR